MRITLQNKMLAPVIALLEAMPLKGVQSRARSKLLTLTRDAYSRFGSDEYELICQYASLTPDGAPDFDADGTFTLRNPAAINEFTSAHGQLLQSEAEIAGPTYKGHLEDLRTLLESFDQELAGEQAEAYNALYDAITTGLNQEKEEGWCK